MAKKAKSNAKLRFSEWLAACAMLVFPIAGHAKPKYGPNAIPVSQDHFFFQQDPALGFWKLIPYYLPQQTESACSAATVAMVINALLSSRQLTSDEKLATHEELLKKADTPLWSKAVSSGGHGVTLDELGANVNSGLKGYGISGYVVAVHHVDGSQGLDQFEAAVLKERSGNDFVIINFDQGVLTGDTSAGHVAPIAAYDPKSKRALILDPDRQWYEPYWSTLKSIVDAMATTDRVSAKHRGFVTIERISGPELNK